MTGIYFDNNATTRVDPAVVEAMLPYFTEQFGNPSSMHSFGNKVGLAIKKARMQVQELLGAEHDSEIIFTSCGTESDSTAIISALKAQPERKEIITTTVEHPAILTLCTHLEKEGYIVHLLKVDGKGRLDLDEYKTLLTDQVAVVSVMWANNETGTFFPGGRDGRTGQCRRCDVPHRRRAGRGQSADESERHQDRHALRVRPQAARTERHRRLVSQTRHTIPSAAARRSSGTRSSCAGTENSTSIVGLGKAAEMALEAMDFENTEVARLRDKLEPGILAKVPRSFVTGDPDNRLPNTSNIAFEFIEGEAILLLLNKFGIAASSGSACTSGSLEPSHVMRAMGIPYTAAHGTVRFSLSRYSTEAEVDRVIQVVPEIIAQLRKLSPYWDGDGPAAEPEKAFAPTYA